MIRNVTNVLSTVWKEPSNRGERGRRILMAIGWQAYKRIVGLPIVLTLDNGLLFYADPRAGNSTSAIYTRIYESKYIQFVRRHCVSGGAIIDVGAHTGIYTLLLAELFRGGLCFEPAPDTFSILVKNLALNHLERFEAIPQAASAKCGRGTLVAHQDFSGTAMLAVESRVAMHCWEVEVTTLDSTLEKIPIEVTFLKIDTEGNEANILVGANDTLSRSTRALVLFENQDSSREECIDQLCKLRFRCFGVNDRGEPGQGRSFIERAYNILACGPAHPLYNHLS